MNLLDKLVEVTLPNEESFLKVKETLTRIGIASKKEQKLFQSCHILHKQGKYYIVHFKELFMLDGKINDFSEEDKARRNTIITLLEEWDLVKTVDSEKIKEPTSPLSQIKILPHKEKGEWELIAKYSIGKKRQLENYTMEVKDKTGPFTHDYFNFLDNDSVVSQELITYYIKDGYFVKRTAVRRNLTDGDYHDSIHVEPLYRIEEN